MLKRNCLLAVLVLLAMTACNLPDGSTPSVSATAGSTVAPPQDTATFTSAPPTETPTLSFTDTPTETPPPTDTPTATLTLTPSIPTIAPTSVDVNCRAGDSTNFEYMGGLMTGETSTLHGKNEEGTWWYIANPDRSGEFCWVSAAVTKTSGDVAGVPVLPDPAGMVTFLSVTMTPSNMLVPGCVFPYTFTVKFKIHVNGPATVVFHRSKSNGMTAPDETILFTKYGDKEYDDYFAVAAAGTHWYKVTIVAPNSKEATATSKAACP